MPAGVALGLIYAALKTEMAAYAPLTATLAVKPIGSGAAIYDEGSVPQGAGMPYITVGAGTQIPWHTMGMAGSARYGYNCTVQIKAVAQIAEASGLTIMDHVAALLYDGKELTLTGYGSAWCDEFVVHPTIVTTQAGVVTREWPAILRVYCHDT